jgi:phosphohistidine swiveling domain-containing protein
MNKIVFEKVMTRDASMISVKAWNDYFVTASKITGLNWPSPIFIFRGGTVESWRPSKIFFEVLPKQLEKWLNNKKNQVLTKKLFSVYIKNSRILKNKFLPFKKSPMETIRQINHISYAGSPGLALLAWTALWDEKVEGLLFPKKILKQCIKLREHDSIFDDTNTHIYSALLKLSERKKLDVELLKVMSFKEIEQLNSKIITIAKKRLKGYVWYNGIILPLSELKIFLKKHNFILKIDKTVKSEELRGTIASKGRVIGSVHRIFNREQSIEFKKDEILIAPMTTPWYVPIMKIASAFVTDEGGLMSHAAILSRELKKPCIVGTKYATKVFKDGDLVEVDANKGIVKKI